MSHPDSILRAVASAQQAPAVQVATPINDIQLIALIATAQPEMTPHDAVAWALDVLTEAVVQGPRIADKLKLRKMQANNIAGAAAAACPVA